MGEKEGISQNISTDGQGMPPSAKGIPTPKADGSLSHEVASRGGRQDILPFARL